MADICGVAADAGAAYVLLLLSIIAPLIRGNIKAKIVANNGNKDIALDMAEIGQAGWQKRTVPHKKFNDRSIDHDWRRLYNLLTDTKGTGLLSLYS